MLNLDGLVNEMNINWVWKFDVPPRVQLFQWKVMWERLHCKSCLLEKGIINDVNAHYDICNEVPEDVNHVLISCPYATDCWTELTKLKVDIALPTPLMDVANLLSANQLEDQTKSYISSFCLAHLEWQE